MKSKAALYGLMTIIILSAAANVAWYKSIPDAPSCSSAQSIDASIEIINFERKFVGFNTNRENFQFGILSAGESVRRVAFVEHKGNAEVIVTPTGDFASWMEIVPANFFLPDADKQEVHFFVHVPQNAAEGKYNGKILFCFQEE